MASPAAVFSSIVRRCGPFGNTGAWFGRWSPNSSHVAVPSPLKSTFKTGYSQFVPKSHTVPQAL